MRFASSLVASLPLLGAAASNWTQWPTCPNSRRLQSSIDWGATSATASVPPLPTDFTMYEDLHQILKINADDGKLEINDKSPVWAELESLTEEVKIIVTFGKAKTGKSTIASMLGCEMNKDEALLFPTFRDPGTQGRTYTEGIWSTKPFPHTSMDEQGYPRTTQYMIMDMQSLNRAAKFQGKLSAQMTEDALLKMLALLSEVVSVFVYTVGAQDLSLADWNTIGTAFQTTRQNMVLRSAYEADGSSAADKALDLKAHNDPAMILVPRFRQDKDKLVLPTSFEIDSAFFETKAKVNWDVLCEPNEDGACTGTSDFGTLMKQNFEGIQHAEGNVFPFIYTPLPEINEGSKDSGNFNWANHRSYLYEAGDACRVYEAMDSERWNCSEEVPSRASDPSVYKMLIRNMVNTIVDQAPVRLVSWKDQKAPVRLTGDRMQNILTVGLEEMNSVGPLPQSELWRKIMQDRCKGELNEWLEFTYGKSQGQSHSGLLQQVSNGLDDMRNSRIPGLDTLDQMSAKWAEFANIWLNADPMTVGMNNWFEDKTLMKAVMATCLKQGEVRAELINQTFATYVEEWNVVHEIKRRQIVEQNLAAARTALANLEMWNALDDMKLYILAFGTIGLGALFLLMRMFRQFNQTCRFCTGCCGDIGDTSTTTRIIVKSSHGTTIKHTAIQGRGNIPRAEAVAVGHDGTSSSTPKKPDQAGMTFSATGSRPLV